MKAILLIVVLLLAAGGYFFYTNVSNTPEVVNEELPQAEEETEESGEASGTITSVDTTAAMVDGPVLVTIKTSAGASRIIAVPSMGFNMCVAKETIADPFALKAGTKVSVRGSVTEEGYILPCEDASHYLKVSAE